MCFELMYFTDTDIKYNISAQAFCRHLYQNHRKRNVRSFFLQYSKNKFANIIKEINSGVGNVEALWHLSRFPNDNQHPLSTLPPQYHQHSPNKQTPKRFFGGKTLANETGRGNLKSFTLSGTNHFECSFLSFLFFSAFPFSSTTFLWQCSSLAFLSHEMSKLLEFHVQNMQTYSQTHAKKITQIYVPTRS